MFKIIRMPFFNAETDLGGSATGEDVNPEVDADIVPDAGEQETNEQVEAETPDAETDEDDLPALPAEQQTAFQKRLEREQRKLEEKLRTEYDTDYKGKYNKHEQIIQKLGGDPDAIERAIEEQRLVNDANRQAQQYGWSEEETQYYIRQQRMEQELQDLRIQNQVNDLRDNPDYVGIGGMKKEIADMVKRSNGALTVEQAYWAFGGKNRSEQIKREAQQREIAKRSQAKRTVQTDSSSAAVPTSSFTADELAAIKELGMTAEQAQELMKTPNNLYEYRSQKKKK